MDQRVTSFDASPETRATSRSPAECLFQDGVAVIRGVLDPALLEQIRGFALGRLEEYLALAEAQGGIGLGSSEGYQELVQWAPGRYDVELTPEEVPLLSVLSAGASEGWWQGSIAKVLGGEPRGVVYGALIAVAGASIHPWHTDGPHLFDHLPEVEPKVDLPPHCMNVFAPLTPQNDASGRLEVCLGSQRMTARMPQLRVNHPDHKRAIGFEGEGTPVSYGPGDVVLQDYRALHRVGANTTDAPRVVLYATCSAPWFVDHLNYPKRSLRAGPRLKRGHAMSAA